MQTKCDICGEESEELKPTQGMDGEIYMVCPNCEPEEYEQE